MNIYVKIIWKLLDLESRIFINLVVVIEIWDTEPFMKRTIWCMTNAIEYVAIEILNVYLQAFMTLYQAI